MHGGEIRGGGGAEGQLLTPGAATQGPKRVDQERPSLEFKAESPFVPLELPPLSLPPLSKGQPAMGGRPPMGGESAERSGRVKRVRSTDRPPPPGWFEPSGSALWERLGDEDPVVRELVALLRARRWEVLVTRLGGSIPAVRPPRIPFDHSSSRRARLGLALWPPGCRELMLPALVLDVPREYPECSPSSLAMQGCAPSPLPGSAPPPYPSLSPASHWAPTLHDALRGGCDRESSGCDAVLLRALSELRKELAASAPPLSITRVALGWQCALAKCDCLPVVSSW